MDFKILRSNIKLTFKLSSGWWPGILVLMEVMGVEDGMGRMVCGKGCTAKGRAISPTIMEDV